MAVLVVLKENAPGRSLGLLRDQARSVRAMASQTPASAELSSSSSAPDPLVTYIVASLRDPIKQADNLFARYKAAGIKYHSMPFAVRASTHLEDDMISMLDEVYSLTSDRQLPACVADTFSDLIYCISGADSALRDDNQDAGAADSFVFDAFNVAEKLEKRVYATEAAVADVVAIKNSLNEQGLLVTPDPWADARLACFEEWANVLVEWTGEMAEMANEISVKSSGLDAIFGFGG